jgi:hypothetical protein
MTTIGGTAPMVQIPHATTATPRLVHDPLRSAVAVGVATSMVLHGQMSLTGMHGPFWSAVMGAMALGCLSCLAGLLRPGRPQAPMAMTMGMAVAMALIHVLMLPLMADAVHAHHDVTAEHALTGAVPDSGQVSMVLVVVLELAVAALAVIWLRRHKHRDPSS